MCVQPEVLSAHFGEDKMQRFRALCEKHDPSGQFRNDWVKHLVWGEEADQQELAFQELAMERDHVIDPRAKN